MEKIKFNEDLGIGFYYLSVLLNYCCQVEVVRNFVSWQIIRFYTKVLELN